MACCKLAKGFTLIEMIVVILIVSVLAVFVTFSWPGMTLNLGAEAQQLANDLRYTQALSMTQNSRYCLTIGSNSYQIVNSATSAAVQLAMGNTSVSLGSNISFGTISPSAGMFVFDGEGMPYYSSSTTCNSANAGGATAVASTASIPLTSGGQTRTVSITPTTGMVSVQ